MKEESWEGIVLQLLLSLLQTLSLDMGNAYVVFVLRTFASVELDAFYVQLLAEA